MKPPQYNVVQDQEYSGGGGGGGARAVINDKNFHIIAIHTVK